MKTMKNKSEKKPKETILTRKLLEGVPTGTVVTMEVMEWEPDLKKEVLMQATFVKISNKEFYSDDYGYYGIDSMLNYSDRTIKSISIPTKHDFVKVKSVLDNAERRYLHEVIRPFKKRVRYIVKECGYSYDCEKIRIQLEDTNDFELPEFEEDTMYKGMELNKEYTADQLCL